MGRVTSMRSKSVYKPEQTDRSSVHQIIQFRSNVVCQDKLLQQISHLDG